MELNIACGSWIKDEDEKVLAVLRASDRWLSAAELSERTGVPLPRVRKTLHLLKQQMAFSEGRKRFFTEMD